MPYRTCCTDALASTSRIYHPSCVRCPPSTRLDTVARYFHTPMRKSGGMFLKDDQFSKSVQDYLAEKYLHVRGWKGRYEPSQIVRNFFGRRNENRPITEAACFNSARFPHHSRNRGCR